jgi:hypothetical protein
VATLTYDYSQSIAVVGPLGGTDEPHSWNLCEFHASRMTAPRGWEMLRNVPSYGGTIGAAALDDDLTALADTVREQPRRGAPRPAAMRSLPSISSMRPTGQFSGGQVGGAVPPADRVPAGNQAGGAVPPAGRLSAGQLPPLPTNPTPRPSARRGHLRVLPDPVD